MCIDRYCVGTVLFFDGGLRLQDVSCIDIEILIGFLISDVQNMISEYKKIVQTPNAPCFGGNTTHATRDGEYFEMSDLYADDLDAAPFLRIHRDELLKVLEAWEKILEKKPKKVTISRDGEVFKVSSE